MKILALIFIVVLSGCATRGVNYVPVVDMQNKDALMLAVDTAECQKYSQQRVGAGTGAVVGALVGAVFMTVLAPKNSGNQWARDGAIVGGTGGAVGANETQESIIKKCLTGRGYNVLN